MRLNKNRIATPTQNGHDTDDKSRGKSHLSRLGNTHKGDVRTQVRTMDGCIHRRDTKEVQLGMQDVPIPAGDPVGRGSREQSVLAVTNNRWRLGRIKDPDIEALPLDSGGVASTGPLPR